MRVISCIRYQMVLYEDIFLLFHFLKDEMSGYLTQHPVLPTELKPAGRTNDCSYKQTHLCIVFSHHQFSIFRFQWNLKKKNLANMWFTASGLLVLFLYVNPTLSKDSTDAVIKSAILSLARVIRDNSERVERSQAREHHMNENLQKSVEDLSKKVSVIDTFVTRFSKIESQLSNFEELISQKDERERIQMEKTIWSIEKLEISMEERLSRITNRITEIGQSVNPDMISKLDNAEAHLVGQIAQIESRLNSTAIQNDGKAMQAEKLLQSLFTKLDEKERSQNQRTENVIKNFENRLKTELENIKDTITEVSQSVKPDMISKLDNAEAHLVGQIAQIESQLNSTAIKNDGKAMQAEKLLQSLFTKLDEEERSQNQRTENLRENFENRLKTELEKIRDTITEVSQSVKPDMISKLDNAEAHLVRQITQIESRLNSTAVKNDGKAMQAEKLLQSLSTKLDEKERSLNQRTENLIENSENRLKTELEKIKDTITDVSQRCESTEPTTTPESISASEIMAKLDATEAHFLEKVARIESRLNGTAIKNDRDAAMQAETLQALITKIEEKSGKERNQNQKTERLIENLGNDLKHKVENIERTVTEISQDLEPESVTASDIISKLNDTKAHFLQEVARIEARLNTTAIENEGQAATQAEKLQTLFNKINETERSQNQTQNLIENLEERLRRQLNEIKDTITEVSRRVETTEPTTTTESVSASDIMSKLSTTEAQCMKNVRRIESRLISTTTENEENAAKQAEKLQSEVKDITDKLEIIVNYVEKATNQAEEEPKEQMVDIGAICEEQIRALGDVTELVKDTLNRIQVLPSTSDAQLLHNETQKALQEAKHFLQSTVDDGINQVINSVDKHNNETKDSIGNLGLNLATGVDDVNKKLQELGSGLLAIMFSTSEDIDTLKNRLEYGISGIMNNVENLTKSNNAANKTLSDKIVKISNDIIDNHNKTLKKLIIKTEEELNLVWRQIGTVLEKIAANAKTLENLDKQSKRHAEGTNSSMNSIDTKVEDIQLTVKDMKRNVDNSIGQRSLMTQEFNTIKNSLGQTLADFKALMKEIQEKPEDLRHPGRQSIRPDYQPETLAEPDRN